MPSGGKDRFEFRGQRAGNNSSSVIPSPGLLVVLPSWCLPFLSSLPLCLVSRPSLPLSLLPLLSSPASVKMSHRQNVHSFRLLPPPPLLLPSSSPQTTVHSVKGAGRQAASRTPGNTLPDNPGERANYEPCRNTDRESFEMKSFSAGSTQDQWTLVSRTDPL